jgi:site-specific recombinase XerD
LERSDTSTRAQRSRRANHSLNAVIQSYCWHIEQTLSRSTLVAYRQSLRLLAAELGDRPIRDVAGIDIARFIRARRDQGRSEDTIRGDITRIRTFFGWALQAGHISANPCQLVPPPKSPQKAGRTIDEAGFRRLLAYAVESVMPFRDSALLWLLWDTGARINELCQAELADLDLKTRTLHLRWENVKTKAERIVPFTDSTAGALADYLNLERGTLPGPLFISSRTGEAFAPQTGSLLVRKLAKRAGLEASPHDFRRAFISRMQEAGLQDSVIMTMSGHSSMTMLLKYTRARRQETALQHYRARFG